MDLPEYSLSKGELEIEEVKKTAEGVEGEAAKERLETVAKGESVLIEAEPGYAKFVAELEEGRKQFDLKYITSQDFAGDEKQYTKWLQEYAQTKYGPVLDEAEEAAYWVEDFEAEIKKVYEEKRRPFAAVRINRSS